MCTLITNGEYPRKTDDIIAALERYFPQRSGPYSQTDRSSGQREHDVVGKQDSDGKSRSDFDWCHVESSV